MTDERPRVPTFIKDYDHELGGGIPKGSIVMVTGAPGSMKSTLCFYILFRNVKERDMKGMYMNIEQTRDAFEGQMMTMGLPLKEIEGSITLLDLSKYRENLDDFGGDEGWIDMVGDEVKKLVEKQAIEMVIIDSLDALEAISGVKSPREQLFQFFRLLKDLKLTTFIITEAAADDEDPAMMEAFMVDGLLLLRDFEISEIDFQLRLRCLKMRGTKHSRAYFNLCFSDGAFSVVPAIVK
jgi:KaiC/GvpD/RAD55 family RecA-like ATPase